MLIGLTGLIGSGKTTVANIFSDLGVKIIDTDIISHKLTSLQGEAIPFIDDAFEGVIVNGVLNRGKLREIVFNDSSKHQQLESIMHPLIYEAVLSEIDIVNFPYNILVVPLLFRSQKYIALTKENIFVDCPYELLLSRLNMRSNLSKKEVDAILANQVDRNTQLKMANDIIINIGDLDSLKLQVMALHAKYMKSDYD
ncbi:MAG: dephospho-CoA kinase [Burkholderiales bacterium]|nr:dephospho-CoA kinase [Burkholderiales bacterium]